MRELFVGMGGLVEANLFEVFLKLKLVWVVTNSLPSIWDSIV